MLEVLKKEELSEVHNALKKEALAFSRDYLDKTKSELIGEIRLPLF